jgi:hypothetical protein
MWNFGIPYALKYDIDCIVQPGYVFQYNESGIPVPMVHGKKMVCVTARGGDYSATTGMHVLDFQEPYLKSIFGFIGITDTEFITVQPTDVPSLREAAFEDAHRRAHALGAASRGAAGRLRPSWPRHTAAFARTERGHKGGCETVSPAVPTPARSARLCWDPRRRW